MCKDAFGVSVDEISVRLMHATVVVVGKSFIDDKTDAIKTYVLEDLSVPLYKASTC